MITDLLIPRMIRAAKLDVNLYEEVEHDPTTTPQAMLVVIIAAIATGIGLSLRELAVGQTSLFINRLIGGSIAALIGWLIWSFITYILGITIFKTPETEATYGQLLRTIGFSASPGTIRIFTFIPGLGAFVAIAGGIWQLVAMIIAVRQALDFTSTWRAVATCAVGWIIEILLVFPFLKVA
jgi:hypothetical protein